MVICVPFCRVCGQELPKDAAYCFSCGAPVGTVREEFSVSSDDLVGRVKALIQEANVRRIIVKNEEGRTLLEVPVSVGAIGAIIAPWAAALGVIAAMVTRCTIVVERRE